MALVKVRRSYQVTIPKKLGKEVGLEEGDYVEVETSEQGILLKPVKAVFILKKQLTNEKVLSLVREGEITSSRGAELLGMQYQDFLDLMHEEGVPLINLTSEMMKKTHKNAEELFSKKGV
ncbi:AbrB/MazE/SpoVT family DNA-binding domain-containing protein [Candidatus Poribacteria bacterium]|nr:AbrB/MazE/SpoVT family DNA-binding domain-containing protein [Candidatus Poribacteria bacterium]